MNAEFHSWEAILLIVSKPLSERTCVPFFDKFPSHRVELQRRVSHDIMPGVRNQLQISPEIRQILYQIDVT